MSSVITRRFRIVVALDQSEYAEIVLEHALDLAARYTMPDLHFVTVVEDESLSDTKDWLAVQVLDGLGNFASPAPDWRARLHVRAGQTAEEIVALAGELDADMIVIGRFGVHKHSVAHRVLDQAPCPVLAVNLLDRPLDTPACPECVRIRAESDGERWFCSEHSAPDRVTLATTSLASGSWLGGTLMW
jgi:nucleotide-binding universal stress UspA family protein